MGTTLTSLQNDSGVGLRIVVAIEGFDRLITDASSTAELAAVVTAWAATEWTQAIGGLQLMGSYEQKFEAWSASIEPGLVSFGVMDCDRNDTFGKAIWNRGGGTETYLEGSIDCNDTTITAKRVNDFTAATSTAFIDTECFEYSAKSTAATPDTFTASKRGLYAPFKASSETQQRFGREHRLPLVADGVYMLPVISQTCREFRGKWVGIWAHRISGTTLDTRAQAQLIFAGKIIDWSDAENGMTVVTCEDAKGTIRDTVLLHDQWSAKIAEGITLTAGMRFTALDRVAGNTSSLVANDLVVLASGASTVNEINAGRYTRAELCSAMNDWLASEKAASRLGMTWTWSHTVQTDEGIRTRVRFTNGLDNVYENKARATMPSDVRTFLGMDGAELFGGLGHQFSGTTDPYNSLHEPYRLWINESSITGTTYDVEDQRGTFVDNSGSGYLPLVFEDDGVSNYGVVQFNDGPMALFRQVDSNTIEYQVGGNEAGGWLAQVSGERWAGAAGGTHSLLASQTGELKLRQVFILAGNFDAILTKLMVSTGTTSYNGVQDVLPAQMGAAIPWEILGTNWTTSSQSLTAGYQDVTLVIDKPTRLMDVIGIELAVRMATIVWRSQGLRIATWGTPAAALSTIALSASNKGADPKSKDKQVTIGQATDRFLVNHIKLEYNRRPDGSWASVDTIEHPASINAVGAKSKTFKMRNTFSGVVGDDAAINGIRTSLLQSMGMFARPLHIVRRTVNLAYFEDVAPGDFGTITDTNVRDPLTGARGITSKPFLVVGHRRDFGGYEIDSRGTRSARCEIDCLILPLANIATYSPAADITSYVAGTKVATCVANAYSQSTDSPGTDVEYFTVGDKVLVLERDPDDPAAAEATSDTIAARGTNTLTLTTGFTPTAGKSYVIVSDTYTTAVTAQKSDVYQADDVDGLVADTVAAYAYGWAPSQSGTWSSDTGAMPVELYSTNLYGDGRPLDTHGERAAAYLCNSLVNYRTGTRVSTMGRSIKQIASGVRGLIEWAPVFFGPGDLLGGERLIYLHPFLRRSAAGAEEFLYATLCRYPPTGSSRVITTLNSPEYQLLGPLSATVSWGVTSATWAMGAEKTISIRAANADTGMAYLVLEAQANVQTYGVSGFLGPFVGSS